MGPYQGGAEPGKVWRKAPTTEPRTGLGWQWQAPQHHQCALPPTTPLSPISWKYHHPSATYLTYWHRSASSPTPLSHHILCQ